MEASKWASLFLIRESDGKLLVPVRPETKKTFPGCYDFAVGGRQEGSETLSECMHREMMEELGLKMHVKKIGRIARVSNGEGGGIQVITKFITACLEKRLIGSSPRK